MKENKKALRRWKSQCKFEKRIRIWVPANKTQLFFMDDGRKRLTSAEIRDEIRAGKCWNFLKWTSTPCSCSMCSGEKYKRMPKGKINKQIWGDILDDMALWCNG
jgi:hypothetical protein